MAENYKALIGKRVFVPCETTAYIDSDGNMPLSTLPAGNYICNYSRPGHLAPIHIKAIGGDNGNDDIGWIKFRPTNRIKIEYPVSLILDKID